MPDNDLLIAQLQRRNRILGGSIFAGLAVIFMGLVFVLIDDFAGPQETTTPISEQVASPPVKPLGEPLIVVSPAERNAFLAALQQFDQELKVEIDAFPALKKTISYTNLITQVEAQLVQLTSSGKYREGVNVLDNASKKIKRWMAADLAKFEQLISDADVTWQDKKLNSLSGILAIARTLYTGDNSAIDRYDSLVADWPAVGDALAQANKAQAENRPVNEQKALQKITQLTHDIPDLQQRLAAIEQRLKHQRIDDLLNVIAQAIAARDVPNARTGLKWLKSLDPTTPEIPKLTNDLAQMEEDLAFDEALRKMDKFATADNWQAAHKVANANRQRFNAYERFQQRADFVNKMFRLITSTKAIVNAPDQLIKKAVQQQAITLLEDGRRSEALSPSLKILITKLDRVLTAYKTPLGVVVLSDSSTFIEVKTVGQVGMVAQKSITLLPGNYIFEGKRKGYMTIRIPVQLRPGDDGKQITVIANEQI